MLKPTLCLPLLMFSLSATPAMAGDKTQPNMDVIHTVQALNKSAKEAVMIDVTYLGVTATPVSQAMNSQLNLPKGLGLLVTHVAPDSPADGAGLIKHDVLHKLDDQLLANFDQFTTLIRLREPGDTASLVLIRGGESMTLSATLGEQQVPEHTLTRRDHPATWIAKPNMLPYDVWKVPPPHINEDILRQEFLSTEPGRKIIFPHDFTTHSKDRYKLRILDEGYKINITKLSDDGPLITVEDAEGKVLHDGPWDPESDPQASGLPENIVKQINDILAAPRIGQPLRIKADVIEFTAPPEATE